MDKPFVIGVLGGMGTYATLNLFQQYTKLFPAVKEWERPRILIDNNCTMPSRVRAILYNENKEQLIREMTDSLNHLKDAGASRIILACNTSHLFLDDIYKLSPKLKQLVVNILDVCVARLVQDGIPEAYVLATEGTLLSGVYQKKLNEAGIICKTPSEAEFPLLRDCIQAVKQDVYTDEVYNTFNKLLNISGSCCILGCTELPVLFERMGMSDKSGNRVIYDPLLLALKQIRNEYNNRG